MMDLNRKQVVEAFIELIGHLADREYQRRAWIMGEKADFDETVCDFFDIGDPILANYKDFRISESQYKLLEKLRDEFQAFADEHNFPEEFIDTPEWAKIMDSAKKVLQAFNYPMCS